MPVRLKGPELGSPQVAEVAARFIVDGELKDFGDCWKCLVGIAVGAPGINPPRNGLVEVRHHADVGAGLVGPCASLRSDPVELIDGHDEDDRRPKIHLAGCRTRRFHHLGPGFRVGPNDRDDVINGRLIDAHEERRIGLLEESAGALQTRCAVRVRQQRVDHASGIFVVDNRDDQFHGREYDGPAPRHPLPMSGGRRRRPAKPAADRGRTFAGTMRRRACGRRTHVDSMRLKTLGQ